MDKEIIDLSDDYNDIDILEKKVQEHINNIGIAVDKKQQSSYYLPVYTLNGPGGLIQINHKHPICYVKSGFEGDPQDGIITEDVLAMLIVRLRQMNKGDLANEYNSEAIGHLKRAMEKLILRKLDREQRGVIGTRKA